MAVSLLPVNASKLKSALEQCGVNNRSATVVTAVQEMQMN
jgi:hypothetical protein